MCVRKRKRRTKQQKLEGIRFHRLLFWTGIHRLDSIAKLLQLYTETTAHVQRRWTVRQSCLHVGRVHAEGRGRLHAVGQRRAVRRFGREERGFAEPHSTRVMSVAVAVALYSRSGGGTSASWAGGLEGVRAEGRRACCEQPPSADSTPAPFFTPGGARTSLPPRREGRAKYCRLGRR